MARKMFMIWIFCTHLHEKSLGFPLYTNGKSDKEGSTVSFIELKSGTTCSLKQIEYSIGLSTRKRYISMFSMMELVYLLVKVFQATSNHAEIELT